MGAFKPRAHSGMNLVEMGTKLRMKIGIVGSDPRAVAIGRLFAEGGHDLCFGDPEGLDRAEHAADLAGGQADTPYNEAMVCELLVLATPRAETDAILAQTGAIAEAAVVVDAMEGLAADSPSGSEMLARKLDSHRVVRALIVLPQPGANISICGDDPDAKAIVEEALHACGCQTTDRGPLAKASELEPHGTRAA